MNSQPSTAQWERYNIRETPRASLSHSVDEGYVPYTLFSSFTECYSPGIWWLTFHVRYCVTFLFATELTEEQYPLNVSLCSLGIWLVTHVKALLLWNLNSSEKMVINKYIIQCQKMALWREMKQDQGSTGRTLLNQSDQKIIAVTEQITQVLEGIVFQAKQTTSEKTQRQELP